MIGTLAMGTLVGVGAMMALGAEASRTVAGYEAASVDEGRSVAALLVGADHSNLVERHVDLQTGGLGFSHVIVDAAELDDTGVRLAYDCFPREGVRRVRLSERYGSGRGCPMRPIVRVVVPMRWSGHVRSGLAALVGQPYDAWTAFVPSRGGLVCSQMVMRVLPPELTRCVRPHGKRHPISPNDLARAFGVASPYSHDVMVQA